MNTKLSKLYLDMATNGRLRNQFNAGNNTQEIRVNRTELLKQYGINDAESILDMSQSEIESHIADELRASHSEWKDLNKMNANKVNSDNKITELGL